jgi:hypothetical protein
MFICSQLSAEAVRSLFRHRCKDSATISSVARFFHRDLSPSTSTAMRTNNPGKDKL